MYLMFCAATSSKNRFIDYATGIKDDLLNQMISPESSSRKYYESEYDKLYKKYLDKINRANYNKICASFVHEVYNFIPIPETM